MGHNNQIKTTKNSILHANQNLQKEFFVKTKAAMDKAPVGATHVRVVKKRGDADAYLSLVQLSNEANQLSQQGNLHSAERLYRSILTKKPGAGFDDVSIALTQNEFGIVLRELGKHDEGLAVLQSALAVRERFDREAGVTIALSDSNITRDEIAKVYEAQGDCEKALEIREPGKRICSNVVCQTLEYKELHGCSRCKCVFYCGKNCQRDDWKRHKSLCQPRKAAATK